jgi:starch phosphorylase
MIGPNELAPSRTADRGPSADSSQAAAGRAPLAEEAQAIAADIQRHARYSLCRPLPSLSPADLFTAVALSVRDRLIDGLFATEQRHRQADAKSVSYLSIEWLIGQSLGVSLDSLGLRASYREALRQLGADLAEVERAEPDAALGNGGLGRLAACFLESLATHDYPAWGYGINYEYGLFRQEIDDGYQREKPDNWLAHRSPWQIERPDEACFVPIYGRVEHGLDRTGGYNPMWLDWQVLVGIPHDMLIVGHGGRSVHRLRLYSARSSQSFDMQIFNSGDYLKAVERKMASENVSKVLYPSDAGPAGKELRLLQEYFLVACSVRDIIRRFEREHSDLADLPNAVAVQLNDTHPALAVVELMRILVDEKAVAWVDAWEITRATFGYTNHTLAAEALERWSVALVERLLPRHLQIIYELNRRLLQQVAARHPGDPARLARLSLIDESSFPELRMSHVAMLGSHSINGVSLIHSKLVETEPATDFHDLWPEKFINVTNGVSQRRWLLHANPELAELIGSRVGNGWLTDLNVLRGLEDYATDAAFQGQFLDVKHANKVRLARFIQDTLRVGVDPESLFDVHAKRMHTYKRQLLKVLHIVHDYLELINGGAPPTVPRTYIFAGKAAPGYQRAKQIIKLIHNVARTVNADRRAHDHLRVVFLPDYRVSLAEQIIVAADIGEQISTAGTEASGTSNMKLALNGALGVCTEDGANVELLAEVGAENLFMFGSSVAEVRALRQPGAYHPGIYRDSNAGVRRLLEGLDSDLFAPGQPGFFDWVVQTLLDERDEHLHLADLPSYLDAQSRASDAFADRAGWARRAILNVARSGRFSSDRSVAEYARNIWHLRPA